METILNFFRTEMFLYCMAGGLIILLIFYIINCIRLGKIRKDYKTFMKKLGNGNNIEEMLKSYIYKVEDIDVKNQEIQAYCNKLDNDMAKCIQKIGIVRYSAFKDMGSDLSFTLALLDEKNDGVILNGIYSRELSNIYAKPIKNGKSTYTLSEEEKQAIDLAMKTETTHKVRE